MRAVLLCLALSGCASQTALIPRERAELGRSLAGPERDRFLRLSFYVTPFFDDPGKRLLTAVPPEEVRLIEDRAGAPIDPGPVERILPVGTRVRILDVEFPTGPAQLARAQAGERVPASRPWIYLEVEGDLSRRPIVLVLRERIEGRAEFLAEVERFLSEHDPSRLMSGWSSSVRAAVLAKTAVLDMPADALEMAWGYPELRRIRFEGDVKQERWLYPGRARTAHLEDGRVARLETGEDAP